MWTRDYNTTQSQKDLIAMSSKEFDEYMCRTYPKQFAQRNLPASETCMCWGFEIGPGWRPLLDELCFNIQVIMDAYPIVLEFVQIKEKLGSGRFYARTMIELNDEESPEFKKLEKISRLIDEIVSHAEEVSNYICAETGKWYDVKIRLGGWIYDISGDALIASDPERYKKDVEELLEAHSLREEIGYACYGKTNKELKKILTTLTKK